MGIEVEGLIGSIGRECLERHLNRILRSYFDYKNSGTYLALNRDEPVARCTGPRVSGTVVSVPQVAGLDHRYRRAA